MKIAMICALVALMGCVERGQLGQFCKEDGTCLGTLVCVKRFERVYRSEGESLVYRCVLPMEALHGPAN